MLEQLHKPVTINALTVQLVNTNQNLEKAFAFPVFQVNGTTLPKASQPTIALSVWQVHFHPPTQRPPIRAATIAHLVPPAMWLVQVSESIVQIAK
jgi:hypothetical protein